MRYKKNSFYVEHIVYVVTSDYKCFFLVQNSMVITTSRIIEEPYYTNSSEMTEEIMYNNMKSKTDEGGANLTYNNEAKISTISF